MTRSLRDIQQDFAAAVFEETTAALAHLHEGKFGAQRHLQVYRNNTRTNLTEALAAVYPVVQRLVGTDFFGFAADRYIRRHPPRSGNLHDFGDAYAAFLSAFEPAQSLSYLPDVARLEWAWHQSFHAANAEPFDITKLSSIAPDSYESVIFQLHPSARLVSSAFPILRIWEVNQPEFGGEEAVDLNEGADHLLVVRRRLQVEIEKISPGDYALLSAFQAGDRLGVANVKAAAHGDFDLLRALHHYLQSGAIVDFHFAQQ